MHPQPRTQNKTSIRVSHHGHTGTTRHSPRNGFTAYFALSPVTTLFDTVACASYRRLDANDFALLPPGYPFCGGERLKDFCGYLFAIDLLANRPWTAAGKRLHQSTH